LVELEQKPLAAPGEAVLVGLCVNQYDIRTDFLNAFPGDPVIIPVSRKPREFSGAGDNNGADITFRDFQKDIPHKAQTLPCADADDLLALKLGKFHSHTPFLKMVLVQGMRKNAE